MIYGLRPLICACHIQNGLIFDRFILHAKENEITEKNSSADIPSNGSQKNQ